MANNDSERFGSDTTANAAAAGQGRKYGATIMAESCRQQGCDIIFGIVGYPMGQFADQCQKTGMRYFGFRNEQAAGYAAAAVGYLTGRPGLLLVVTGPGVLHAVAGAGNAKENCWPMLTFGGAHERNQRGLGGFQETGQLGDIHMMDYMRPACKYCTILDDATRIPFFIEQAVRYSIEGRPGPCYLDVPADLMREAVSPPPPQVPRCPDPSITLAAETEVEAAVALLKAAKAPLLITGKGGSYAGATPELIQFVNSTNCPFLPTPMGKGCIPDDHQNNVSAARSTALSGADVVILSGARLNWILHFGQPPRYRDDCRFIKMDINPEEMQNGSPAACRLVGHLKGVAGQLNKAIAASGGISYSKDSEWWKTLASKVAQNEKVSADLASDKSMPFNFYYPLTTIQKNMPRDANIMQEGAQTMDIGRTILQNYRPCSRLDAGTWGTMGVGLAQVIAFCAAQPQRKTVAVMGDAAFGFTMAEYETINKYKLNALIIILNNNGIGGGSKVWNPEWDKGTEGALKIPPGSHRPTNQYELLANAFGGNKWHVNTPEELETLLPQAMATTGPGIFHVRIAPTSNRKKQEMGGFDPTGEQAKKALERKAKAKL